MWFRVLLNNVARWMGVQVLFKQFIFGINLRANGADVLLGKNSVNTIFVPFQINLKHVGTITSFDITLKWLLSGVHSSMRR